MTLFSLTEQTRKLIKQLFLTSKIEELLMNLCGSPILLVIIVVYRYHIWAGDICFLCFLDCYIRMANYQASNSQLMLAKEPRTRSFLLSSFEFAFFKESIGLIDMWEHFYEHRFAQSDIFLYQVYTY